MPQSELSHVKAQLSWSAKNDSLYGIFDLDISAFLLNAQYKVVRNDDFIFYGNLKSPCGSIRHSGDDTSGAKEETIIVRLANLPKEIHNVLFVVSLHGGHDIGQAFGKTEEAVVRIFDADRNEEIAYFDLDDAQGDRCVPIGYLTRYNAGWTWKTLFVGMRVSLERIAQNHGVDTTSVRLAKKEDSPICHFWCRHCGAKLAAKENSIGRSNTCPKCQKNVVIERNQPPTISPAPSLAPPPNPISVPSRPAPPASSPTSPTTGPTPTTKGKGHCYGCLVTMLVLILILWTSTYFLEKDKNTFNPSVLQIPSDVKENKRIISPENWQASEAGERKVLTVDGVEYAFRWCPAGTFTMGSPAEEKDRREDETLHQVTLSKGFWMLETEVTQKMWESVMNSNPLGVEDDKQLPVMYVTWDNCQEFITTLNAAIEAGMEGVLARNDDVWRVALPTEAQWEYACRAGTTTPFHFGNKLTKDKASIKHYFGQHPSYTPLMVVGSYPANAWGLYDMHGNVWEWCNDRYEDFDLSDNATTEDVVAFVVSGAWRKAGAYPSDSVTDPVGPSTGRGHRARGGSRDDLADQCRSAMRNGGMPLYQSGDVGFRLCLVSESK